MEGIAMVINMNLEVALDVCHFISRNIDPSDELVYTTEMVKRIMYEHDPKVLIFKDIEKGVEIRPFSIGGAL
jgi:hypothetical protein